MRLSAACAGLLAAGLLTSCLNESSGRGGATEVESVESAPSPATEAKTSAQSHPSDSPVRSTLPLLAVPTPTPMVVEYPLVTACPAFDAEREVLLRTVQALQRETRKRSSEATFRCGHTGFSVSIRITFEQQYTVSIDRYEREHQAIAALGEPNYSFRDYPAVHVVKIGHPSKESLDASLKWQESRWGFQARTFYAPYEVTPNVWRIADRLFETATDVIVFPPPTPTPTPRIPSLASLQAELDRNRLLWEAAQPEDYALDVELNCPFSCLGKTTATIDELFDHIQWAIDDVAYEIDVEYHPTLGYPTRGGTEDSSHTTDDWFGFSARVLPQTPPQD